MTMPGASRSTVIVEGPSNRPRNTPPTNVRSWQPTVNAASASRSGSAIPARRNHCGFGLSSR